MLNTNELRARAAEFSREWAEAAYERGQAQTFYIEFFEIFGVKSRRVASFEEPVDKLGDRRGYIDLFWKGTLIAEHKSAGKDLTKAKQQALDYFPGLKEAELPRYVLVCDFQNFELYDLDERTEVKFKLQDLPKHVEAFNFILGKKKVAFKDQDPVNIEASELVATIHDALEKANYKGHDLERFLVRIVFCLFADDSFRVQPLFLHGQHRNVIGLDGAPLSEHVAAAAADLVTAKVGGPNGHPTLVGYLSRFQPVQPQDSVQVQ